MEPEKKPQKSQNNVGKNTKPGGITIPECKLYYKAVVIRAVWYWHKNRHIHQKNKTENPEINPQLHGQLIFNKAGKNTQWKKDSLLNKQC